MALMQLHFVEAGLILIKLEETMQFCIPTLTVDIQRFIILTSDLLIPNTQNEILLRLKIIGWRNLESIATEKTATQKCQLVAKWP